MANLNRGMRETEDRGLGDKIKITFLCKNG